MPEKIPGNTLSSMKDIYPVQIRNGVAVLDMPMFVKAIKDVEQRNSPRAISDLIYLGQVNKVYPLLSDAEQQLYDQFLRNNRSFEQDITVYQADHLQQYIGQANALHQMFGDKAIEISLFDTRNPVKSVIVVKNSITGLRVEDAANEEVMRQFENFSATAGNQKNPVVQKVALKDGRVVKWAMIPVYDHEYGLLAMIRISIDTSRLDPELFPAETSGLLNALGKH